MQAMALKYQELATTATDPKEREKLQRYAALYREIAAQTKPPSETPIAQSLTSSTLWFASFKTRRTHRQGVPACFSRILISGWLTAPNHGTKTASFW
jgi:hypothetical protein